MNTWDFVACQMILRKLTVITLVQHQLNFDIGEKKANA